MGLMSLNSEAIGTNQPFKNNQCFCQEKLKNILQKHGLLNWYNKANNTAYVNEERSMHCILYILHLTSYMLPFHAKERFGMENS